jgi:hypothetical protein
MIVKVITPKVAFEMFGNMTKLKIKLKTIITLAILKNAMSNMIIFKMITVKKTTGRATTV